MGHADREVRAPGSSLAFTIEDTCLSWGGGRLSMAGCREDHRCQLGGGGIKSAFTGTTTDLL